MYKHLFKHLVPAFEEALVAKFPVAMRAPKAVQPRVQAVLYSLESAPQLHSFLLLQGNDHDQTFTVELALARTQKSSRGSQTATTTRRHAAACRPFLCGCASDT